MLARADLVAAGGWDVVTAGPGYRTHPFGFVRPLAHPTRSATEIRTFPLTVATS